MGSARRKRARPKGRRDDEPASAVGGPPGPPTSRPFGRGELLALGVILLLGGALRASYLSEIVHAPDFAYPAFDAAFHDHWARALATGDWSPPRFFDDPEIQRAPFFRPPGYPWFLALIYLLSGGSFLAPRVVQAVLGLLNCILVHLLGRSLFGSGAGLVAAALTACCWNFIYFEGELLAPVLLVFLSLALILALRRWTVRVTLANAAAAGVLFGLFALTRPNVLACAPFVLLWIGWVARRRREPRRFVRAALTFSLAAAVTIAPATIRNYVVAKDPVLITSNAGVNLYIGNNPQSDCVTPHIPILGELAGLTGWTCFDQPAIVRGVEQIEGRSLKASEVSSFFSKKALEYIRDHPAHALRLALRKALLFWGPREISNNKAIHFERAHSPTLRWLPGFPVALSLAIMGLLALVLELRATPRTAGFSFESGSQRVETILLILMFVAAYFASFLPFFVAGRYRVPLIPFLLLFGGFGIARAAQHLGARRWKATAIGVGVWLGLYVLASLPLAKYEPDPGRWHFDRGDAYRKQRKTEAAIMEFRQAIATGVWPDPRAYNDLGAALYQHKNIEEALQRFREAVRLKPDYLEAHLNLATALVAQHKLAEAATHFAEVVRLKPDHFEAQYNLGTILLREGQCAEALAPLTAAVRLRPERAYAHLNLAQALRLSGRTGDSVAHYEEATRLEPDIVEAHYQLGAILAEQGNDARAAQHLRRALELQPDHARARRLLAKLRSEQPPASQP